MNNSQVTVTITLNEDVKASKLYFDYKVSTETYGDGLLINSTSGSKITTTKEFVSKFLTVTGGQKVTLTYAKDSYGAGGSDCVWLKNFRLAELHKLTISTPGIVGATIELKDSDGKTVDSAAGSYMVEDGTYSYTISKFGYETKTGTITVAGEDKTESVTLDELAKKTISFNITFPIFPNSIFSFLSPLQFLSHSTTISNPSNPSIVLSTFSRNVTFLLGFIL